MLSRVLPVRSAALILVALVALHAMPPQTLAAKSYNIAEVVIDSQLWPDGTMDITESRTYQFQGDFRFLYRDVPTGGPVILGDFAVSEGGRAYRLADSEEPGTYMISKVSGHTRVTWFYEARDQSRTFIFHYRAGNAIERYEDAAVLYFKFISEDWDRSQKNILIRLRPPMALSRDQIKEWLHGPLWAESQTGDDGTVVARCEHLPAHTYLEVRALYPPEVFAAVPARPKSVRQEIMGEEAGWAMEANRQRDAATERLAAREKRHAIGEWVVPTICLIGLLAWWVVFRKYGRRPQVPTILDMSSDIPERTPPALLSYLLYSRQVAGSAVVGTLLDLARRGFVSLREEPEEKKGLFRGSRMKIQHYWDLKRSYREQHVSELLDYEAALLRFVFEDLAKGQDSISIETIGKERRRFTRFFGEWKKQVEEMGKQKGWFDTASIRGMYYGFAVGGVMIVLTVPAAIFLGLVAVGLGMASFVVFILALLVPHRTLEGETKARQWGAVKKYLRRYQFRTAGSEYLLSRISEYMVYGVVLGLGDRVYKELATHIPADAHSAYVPWYIYHGSATGAFSPASFGVAFSSMVATVTSTMSTASGTGGGASGGGGGGAGSGGGGAG